ncbi:hypothetical protein AAAC51_13740 [Priestia megaterium]
MSVFNLGNGSKDVYFLQKEVKTDVFSPLEEAAEAAKANEPTGETML